MAKTDLTNVLVSGFKIMSIQVVNKNPSVTDLK